MHTDFVIGLGVLYPPPLLSVPKTLSALLRNEQRRFRACLGAFAAAFATILLTAGLSWLVADIPGALLRSLPGALGFYDHGLGVLARHWPELILGVLALTLVASASILILESAFLRGRATRGA